VSKIAIPPPSAATDGPRLEDRQREAGHDIVITDRPTGVQMAFDNIDRALRGELPESVINQEVIPAWRRRLAMLFPQP